LYHPFFVFCFKAHVAPESGEKVFDAADQNYLPVCCALLDLLKMKGAKLKF